MEFAEVVAARRSVRHFNTRVPVTEAEIRGLLHAAGAKSALTLSAVSAFGIPSVSATGSMTGASPFLP